MSERNVVLYVVLCLFMAGKQNQADWLLANDTVIAEEDKELFDIYHRSFSDDSIDIDLLMTMLHEVHSSQDKGKSIEQTGCMEGNPSLRANSSSASQEIPCILWNLNVHSFAHKTPPLVCVLCQMNPVLSYFCTIYFSTTFHSRHRCFE